MSMKAGRKTEQNKSNIHLSNYKHVNHIVNCFTEILPEALRTKCGRCYPSQKETALKVITILYERYPDHYKALREKWDPTGEYNRRFEEYLRDKQFNSIDLDIGRFTFLTWL